MKFMMLLFFVFHEFTDLPSRTRCFFGGGLMGKMPGAKAVGSNAENVVTSEEAEKAEVAEIGRAHV